MNEYDGQPGPSAFELHDWMPPVWNPEGATKQLHVDTTVSLSNRHDTSISPCKATVIPVDLFVVKQPEEQHRARYLSEGSRGAIKDKKGASHCTIKLQGFYRPTRVEMLAVNGSGGMDPHPFYKLIPVSGKSATTTPCKKITAHDGLECLEITLRPEHDMTAVLDCIGILKICSYNSKQQRRQRRSTKTLEGSDNYSDISTRICFRAYINEGTQNLRVIKTATEPIRCVQQLGVPEVLKTSITKASAAGGMEMFIIGRNFDKNTSVLFREYTDTGTMCWSAEAEIQKPFFHQCHIVCSIPEYPHKHQGGTVSMTVKCGQKQSHPTEFVYTPSETRPRPFYNEEQEDEWCPPGSPRSTLKRQWYNSSGASQWDAQSAYDMPYFEYEQPNDYFRNRDDSEESGKKPRHSQH